MTLSLRTLALLQLAVILGIAAGFGFTRWPSQQPTASSRGASEVVPEVGPTVQLPPPSVEPSTGTEPPSNDRPGTLKEWLGGEPMPPSTGSGQIGGIVFLNGKPLAGLEMNASTRIPFDLDEDDDLVDRVLVGVRGAWLRKSLERSCISDEDGRFSFEGLDDDHSYIVRAPGYSLRSADPQVKASIGPPFPNDLEFDARPLQKKNTDAANERPPWATGGVDETVLTCTVEGVKTYSLFLVDGHGPLPEPLDKRDRFISRGTSIFRKSIEPGPYTLVVKERLNPEILGTWTVDVETGFNEFHLAVESPPGMEVVVWSFAGEPIENARFSWRIGSAGSRLSWIGQSSKREGNRYFLTVKKPVLEVLAGGSGQQALLEVHAPSQQKIEVPVNQLGTIEVSFDPVAWLDIDVIGYRGSGLESRLKFILTTDDGENTSSGMLDWLGTLRLGPVPPGHYQLATEKKTHSVLQRFEQIATESVHLAAGEKTLSVALPILYELTLDFADELLGKTVFFRKEGVILDSDILESTRLFTASRPLVISQLAVGEYEVRVDQISKMVRIPEQDSVFIPFEKVEINTMVIRGFITGSSAATSGLEIGDQVIAFNGATFSGMEEMDAIFTPLLSEPEVTLTIIRNGNELTLTLPLTFLMEIVPRFIER